MRWVAAHQIRSMDLSPDTELVHQLFDSLTRGDTQTVRRLAGARTVFFGQCVSAGQLADIAEERELSLVPGSVRATSGWELGQLADDLAAELFGGPVEVTDTIALADLTIGGQVFTAGVVVGRGSKPIRRVFDPSRVCQLLATFPA